MAINVTVLEGSNLGYKSQHLNKENICDIMHHTVLENPRHIGVRLPAEVDTSFRVISKKSNYGI